jgi:hypothetical protein
MSLVDPLHAKQRGFLGKHTAEEGIRYIKLVVLRSVWSALRLGDKCANKFDSFKGFFPVRCTQDFFSQILSCRMFALMAAIYPQIVVCNIIDLVLVSDVGLPFFPSYCFSSSNVNFLSPPSSTVTPNSGRRKHDI